MCEIVGYVGSGNACSFLVECLRSLEYRGYDSSGLAIHNGESLGVTRSVERIESLVGLLLKALSGLESGGENTSFPAMPLLWQFVQIKLLTGRIIKSLS